MVYADNTDAGTASASATYGGSLNYLGSTNSTTFEIEQAETTTVVTCPVSVIYTGVALEPCTAEVTGPALTQSLPVVYADNTDAGTASASATYGGSLNYLGSTNSTTFEIEQAETTTVVTCPVSVIYTGVALEPCTAEVTGPALTQSLPVVYADNTDAGTASASATYGGSLNYLGSTNSTTFEIEQAEDDDSGDLPGLRYLHRRGSRTLHGRGHRPSPDSVAAGGLRGQHRRGYGQR